MLVKYLVVLIQYFFQLLRKSNITQVVTNIILSVRLSVYMHFSILKYNGVFCNILSEVRGALPA